MTETNDLKALGWGPFFQAQLHPDDLETLMPARVGAAHRSAADLIGPGGERRVATGSGPELTSDRLAVGDWVLADAATWRPLRLLERRTVLQRGAAGGGRAQLIAANLDTVFVVSSCNADFNVARLERYLAVTRQGGAFPVVVLTKADLSDEPAAFVTQAARLAAGLMVEAVNAHDPDDVARLAAWCRPGETVAFLGSSGVGKSTLINALAGARLATGGIREDDAKGRHTTTARSMHPMPSGAWLIDTPGMRELRLLDAAEGIETVFEDVAALAAACRFGDCRHESEPGCAVRAALEAGALDPGRLARWRKLAREEAHATASVAEARNRARSLGRLYRSGQARGKSKRGD